MNRRAVAYHRRASQVQLCCGILLAVRLGCAPAWGTPADNALTAGIPGACPERAFLWREQLPSRRDWARRRPAPFALRLTGALSASYTESVSQFQRGSGFSERLIA